MLSRRNFLGLAGGVVVLAACGGDDDDGGSGSDTPAHRPRRRGVHRARRPRCCRATCTCRTTPQRFAFALLAKEGYASQGAVTRRGRARRHDADASSSTDDVARGGAAAEPRRVRRRDRLRPGRHLGRHRDRDGEKLPFAFQVKAKADAPTIGAAAPADPSPTPPNALGVDPICTRDPMCPLHTQSLDTIIGKGRPVAVLFATPARCQSQYCGPVLDSLLPLVDDVQGPRRHRARRHLQEPAHRRDVTDRHRVGPAERTVAVRRRRDRRDHRPPRRRFGQDEMRTCSTAAHRHAQFGDVATTGTVAIGSNVTRTTGRSRRCAPRSGSRS